MTVLVNSSSVSFFTIVLVVGATQGFFLGLALLLLPQSARSANAFLAAFVFAYSLELLFRFSVISGLIISNPSVIPYHWALDVWFGPLIYFYTLKIIESSHSIRTSSLRHFILPLLGVGLATVIAFVYSNETLLSTAMGTGPRRLTGIQWIFAIVGLISMIAYLVGCGIVLQMHRRRIAHNFSYKERISLSWLRNLLTVFAVLLLLYTATGLFGSAASQFGEIYPVSMVLVVFLIGFIGIRQSAVFVKHEGVNAEYVDFKESEDKSNETKYGKSALSRRQARSLFEETERLVDKLALYRQNDLTLPQLADRLGFPSHYISQAINQESGANFFDFINKRRVGYVSDKLAQAHAEKLNILNLAMDAGFNSKSAFYTAFKAHTGLTPTQFRKNTSGQINIDCWFISLF